eukprot:XP_011662624.1 PREDICTED: fibropellin-3-like [Strongylocentrotus purpuratus]
MDVGVTAIDLLNFFPCSGSNINVSVTLVCDGHYDCDNYEDESSCIDCFGANPCLNGGTCENDACTCASGYTGALCGDTIYCFGSNPCQNGGTCENNACTCASGFTGSICERVDCSGSNSCENGGICENNACTCAAGFIGVLCSTVDCSGSNPCRHGGSCENNACTCAAGFNGALCSTVDCSESNPCQNGGTCENNACTCAAGFTGALCSTVDCSGSNPCLNGGTCENNACTCASGFTGPFCGNSDPCSQRNPCVNGVCRHIGQEQYECECQDHYEGIHCDEPTLPLEVSVHPSSQIVNINANVELTCSFNNAKRYHWYKDDVLLPNSENQNSLIIQSVGPSDIGYYFCRGSGRSGETLDTMRASVYVKGGD